MSPRVLALALIGCSSAAFATPTVQGSQIFTDGGVAVGGYGVAYTGAATGSLAACNATAPLAGGTRGLTQYDTTSNTLKYCNGTSYVELTSSPVVGWQTVFDIDFTIQGAQTLTTNGTYLIGGVTWTKINSANDAVAMAVSDAGLVIQPGATSDLGAGRTLPAIVVGLSSVDATISPTTPVRLWAYVSSANYTANFDGTHVGFSNSGSPSMDVFSTFRGFSGASGAALVTTIAGASGSTGVTGAPYSTMDVVLTELPQGVAGAQARSLGGTYSAGFPVGANVTAEVFWGGSSFSTYVAQPTSNWQALLGAMTAGSGTALVVTIARAKLEVYR